MKATALRYFPKSYPPRMIVLVMFSNDITHMGPAHVNKSTAFQREFMWIVCTLRLDIFPGWLAFKGGIKSSAN